jgi:hypothetical protein
MIPRNGLADRLLLRPSRKVIGCAGATRCEIPSPVGMLEAWVSQSETGCGREPEAFALAFCGNGSRAEREMKRALAIWQRHPVEIWAVNYPGYGGSEGRATLPAIGPAALAAYDALAARAAGRPSAAGRPIFLSGCSFGTAACLCVAARREVAGIVLHNAPPLRELIVGYFGWWNLWLLAVPVSRRVPEALDSVANARRSRVPAVFILAGRDLTVPPRFQRLLADAYAGPKEIVEYPTHRHNTPVRGEDLERLQPFIERMFVGLRHSSNDLTFATSMSNTL